MRKKIAFTLAEVLIAMTIVGAVAAMVIPPIIVGQKTNQAKSEFNTAYSILTSVVARMDADNVSLKPASYSTPEDFYSVIKKYQKISHDCGTAQICSPNPQYEDLDPKGAYVLTNGMLVVIEKAPNTRWVVESEDANPGSEPSYKYIEEYAFKNIDESQANNTIEVEHNDILVTIDINGNQKVPNKRGFDVFSFQLLNGDLIPVGARGTFTQTSCSRDDNASIAAAMACSQEAATNGDYFKNIFNNR